MANPTLAELRAVTYKKPDAWWTVLLVDPLAIHLVRWAVRHRWITPNRVTVAAFVLALGAAGCFLLAETRWLIAGAALYYLGFLLDCVDGKLARWQGSGSLFGAWLDYIFDRLRVLVCTVALMWGQYLDTGQGLFLVLGAVVIFLDMFRYLDSLHMAKVQAEMRETARRARPGERPGDPPTVGEDAGHDLPAETPAPVGALAGDEPAFDQSWRRRFSAVVRFRAWTERRRIRPHLVSGVEFQMIVLIVGPLTGAVRGVTLAACSVMLVFEATLIYKFWMSTKDFARVVDTAEETALPDQRSASAAARAH